MRKDRQAEMVSRTSHGSKTQEGAPTTLSTSLVVYGCHATEVHWQPENSFKVDNPVAK